ncbi:MAG: Unknown protein [uncultured Thiotrichaceae bacterium]|uniref:N-acetyltransferase domain-containing protein n=1 Tax=uncultured Thiotrichaceae bacterium TaxID=298394 RepID=A0A6S6U012_9GAMM|nr:MAG: Unknown protein [uncultured Thiotrichaceae bacterium]
MFTIQTATPEDYAEITALDTTLSEFCQDGIQHLDSSMAWRLWLESSITYKAVSSDNKIIGVAVAFSVKKRGWCIHKILISTAYLQDNLAQLLLEKMLAKIDKREEKSFVIVHPQDLYSLKMYSALGYSNQTFHKDYLGKHEDRYVLLRPKRWMDVEKSKKKIKKSTSNPWDIPSILNTDNYSSNRLPN